MQPLFVIPVDIKYQFNSHSTLHLPFTATYLVIVNHISTSQMYYKFANI